MNKGIVFFKFVLEQLSPDLYALHEIVLLWILVKKPRISDQLSTVLYASHCAVFFRFIGKQNL